MWGVQELSLQHISNILWAYASFLRVGRPMAAAFLGELRSRLRTSAFNAQQLSNLLWSLCIAGVPAHHPICVPWGTCARSRSSMLHASALSFDTYLIKNEMKLLTFYGARKPAASARDPWKGTAQCA